MADNKQNWGTLNYAYHLDKLITADSEPDLDGWGFDSYWDASNWVYWFNRNQEKYGSSRAKEKWSYYANKHTVGAAFNDWKIWNPDWVEFLKLNGLDGNFTIISTLAALPGAAASAAENVVESVVDVTEGVQSVTKQSRWIIWLLVAVLLYFVLKKLRLLNFTRAKSSNKYSRYSSLRNKKFRSR